MGSQRNYGIDLLRLVLMYMVCILHTLGRGGVLGACEAGTTEFRVFWFIEILSYCAVDGFAIISGYTATDKPRKYEKLADMWFQAFFYSFVLTVVLTATGLNPDWSIKGLIKLALPVTFETFWYFTAYFALFFVIPILNRFIFSIDEKTARTVLLVCVVLFTCVELLAGAFKTQWGYSALWLMILYCVGAMAKRGKVFEKKKTITLLMQWGVCILLTWCVHVFAGIGRLTSYVSPTIVVSGLIMVILFSRLHLKGAVVARLSPLAFGIYLFQLNPVIWNNCLQGAVSSVVQLSIPVGVICVFAVAALIFFSGLLVEFVRSKLAKAIGISTLSKHIVSVVSQLLNKMSAMLR